MSRRSVASITVKLRGGPFNGQSAVSYGAVLGSLIDVNHRTYRVIRVEPVPGRREEVGTAVFEPRPAPKAPAAPPTKPIA